MKIENMTPRKLLGMLRAMPEELLDLPLAIDGAFPHMLQHEGGMIALTQHTHLSTHTGNGKYPRCTYLLLRDPDWNRLNIDDVEDIKYLIKNVPGLEDHTPQEVEALYSYFNVEDLCATWCRPQKGYMTRFIEFLNEMNSVAFDKAWGYYD